MQVTSETSGRPGIALRLAARIPRRTAGRQGLQAAQHRPARVDRRGLLLRGRAPLADPVGARRHGTARHRSCLLRRSAHGADPGRRHPRRPAQSARGHAGRRCRPVRARCRPDRVRGAQPRLAGLPRPGRRADRSWRGPVPARVGRDHAVPASSRQAAGGQWPVRRDDPDREPGRTGAWRDPGRDGRICSSLRRRRSLLRDLRRRARCHARPPGTSRRCSDRGIRGRRRAGHAHGHTHGRGRTGIG